MLKLDIGQIVRGIKKVRNKVRSKKGNNMPNVFEVEQQQARDEIKELQQRLHVMSLVAWALSHGWSVNKLTKSDSDHWQWKKPGHLDLVNSVVKGRWEAVPPLNDELIELIEAQAAEGR